jgi:hypothetical protein
MILNAGNAATNRLQILEAPTSFLEVKTQVDR